MTPLRPDQQFVATLIKPGSHVIDIGCGDGALLDHLRQEKQVRGHGLEIEATRVAEVLANGISAIQGDADRDLKHYGDKAFDVALLCMTLQIMRKPKDVLEQALRIANEVILVIPNFGHWRTRSALMFGGRMPVTSRLSYQWYETPNIHFSTIRDMVVLSRELGCEIKAEFFTTERGKTHPFTPRTLWRANLFGEQGIFVLRGRG